MVVRQIEKKKTALDRVKRARGITEIIVRSTGRARVPSAVRRRHTFRTRRRRNQPSRKTIIIICDSDRQRHKQTQQLVGSVNTTSTIVRFINTHYTLIYNTTICIAQ